MKQLLITSLALLMVFIFASGTLKAEPLNTTPKLYAVSFYADWCGNCKRLDPEFTKALEQGGWNARQLQFVKLDLTDKVRIGQAVQHSKDLGLYPVLKANGAKTGAIALVDGQSKKELKRFYAGDKAVEIEAAIAQKLAQ